MGTGKDTSEDSWLAQNLRWTSFSTEPGPVDPLSWWKDLIGQPPEASVSRADMGLQQQEGPFGSGRLSLVLLPGRIDWHLNPAPNPAGNEAILNLGSYAAAVQSLRPLLLRWFEICPTPMRVALGAVLIQSDPNLRTGYERLANYLKGSVRVDSEGSSEFTYSINRPRPSRIGSFNMNRLSKWLVAAAQTLQIAAAAGTAQPAVVRTQYFCRLELDMSTPAGLNQGLLRPQLTAIFDEMVALGGEIASKGDIP